MNLADIRRMPALTSVRMRISGFIRKAGRQRWRTWGAEAVGSALIRAANCCRALIETHLLSRPSLAWLVPEQLMLARGGPRKSGDEREDIREHLPRHCNLGHLECNVRAMLTTFAPILTSFSRRLVSDHREGSLCSTSIASGPNVCFPHRPDRPMARS